MCSYRDDPYEAAREFSIFLFEIASVTGFVGLLVSLVASAFLLDGARGAYAYISLAFAVIAVATFQGSGLGWVALVLFLTLVSIVNHPTTQRWVNWPLLFGAASLTASVVYMAVLNSTHPCN